MRSPAAEPRGAPLLQPVRAVFMPRATRRQEPEIHERRGPERLAPEQGEQNDDRQWYTEDVQQQTATETHIRLHRAGPTSLRSVMRE